MNAYFDAGMALIPYRERSGKHSTVGKAKGWGEETLLRVGAHLRACGAYSSPLTLPLFSRAATLTLRATSQTAPRPVTSCLLAILSMSCARPLYCFSPYFSYTTRRRVDEYRCFLGAWNGGGIERRRRWFAR